MRHLENTANCSGTRTDILFCLLTLFDSPWFICWKWRYNTNFYSSMLFKKLITLFAEKQLWYTMQTAQAWLGNSVQPNGSKTFLFFQTLDNFGLLKFCWLIFCWMWPVSPSTQQKLNLVQGTTLPKALELLCVDVWLMPPQALSFCPTCITVLLVVSVCVLNLITLHKSQCN